MRSIVLLIIQVLIVQQSLANNTLLSGLASGDRTTRKDAVRLMEALSKTELLNLAQVAVQTNRLEQDNSIYVFHRILAVAQEKGFSLDESVALLEEHGSSLFKLALLDWMREEGVRAVRPSETVVLLPKVEPHFASQIYDLSYRLAAHAVCREMAWKILQSVRERNPVSDQNARAKATEVLRICIGKICHIVADETERDETVAAFAGYVPYYRSYVQYGVCSENDLKSSVEQALNNRSRGDKCRQVLQSVLSGSWGQNKQ